MVSDSFRNDPTTWNAVHLYKLVNLKKQFQVAVDWSLGTIFPRDAVLFRRPGACKLCAAESAPATAAPEAKCTTA